MMLFSFFKKKPGFKTVYLSKDFFSDTWRITLVCGVFNNWDISEKPTRKNIDDAIFFLIKTCKKFSKKSEYDEKILMHLYKLSFIPLVNKSKNFCIYYFDFSNKWYAKLQTKEINLQWEFRDLSKLVSKIEEDCRLIS